MRPRVAGRVVGALMLVVFPLYAIGQARAGTLAGTVLVLANSAAVVTIGAIVWRCVRASLRLVGVGYLLARAVEALVLGSGVLVAATGGASATYPLAMVALALGSIPLCLALPRLGWAPRWLAWWGVVGYAMVALAMPLEFVREGASLPAAAVGAGFEVVFAVHLLRVGFRDAAESTVISERCDAGGAEAAGSRLA